jgi:hypothetical protein
MGSVWQDVSKREIGVHTLDRGEAIISTIGIPFPAGTRISRYKGSATPFSTELKKEIQAGDPQPVSNGRKPSFKKRLLKIFPVIISPASDSFKSADGEVIVCGRTAGAG